jgi:hypothetical protein
MAPIHEQPLFLPYSDVTNSMEKKVKHNIKKILPYKNYKSESSCRPHFAYDVFLS